MSIKHFIHIPVITSLCAFALVANVYAKSINLYDQPKNDAKVLGTIDLSAGIVPIFTPKTGDWMKVGDPANGNVGWVKTNDINTPGQPTSFSFTQRFINTGKGPQSYQIIQYGEPNQMTSQQVQDTLKKMQAQQKAIQESVQKAVSDMMKDFNGLFPMNMQNNLGGYPVIIPMVIMPTQQQTGTQTNPAAKPATAKPQPAGTNGNK